MRLCPNKIRIFYRNMPSTRNELDLDLSTNHFQFNKFKIFCVPKILITFYAIVNPRVAFVVICDHLIIESKINPLIWIDRTFNRRLGWFCP